MATYTTDKVKYNGNIYKLQDSGALQLTGGTVTGPVTFNDSVSMDEATVGDLVVNGNLSTTNNIQANTINGVSVGSSPKFTDTVTTASTTGSGNAVTSVTASNGVVTATKGTTFLTSHQDISGKADKSATVSTVAYDSTNKKLTKTINGTTSDVVTVATLKTALSLAKGDVGLGNVENKSSATIRGELTKDNVTSALGYTPPTTNTTYSNATTSAAGLMSSTDKSKLDGIASGAEVNQNAFSNVKVGSTTVAADGKTDTLELAGSNVTLTPDATNDKVTIGITKDNVTAALGYTPPTTNTTYSNATTSAAGLMSSTDKSKLDGIAAGAQVNTVISVAGKTGDVTLAKGDVGLGNVGNFKAVSTAASQGLTDTEKSNARANIGAGTSSFNGAYSSLSGKPTLGTASAKDVPSSGNASTSQVVMGNDTRLTNSRPASDVSAWAKASSKPSYTASEVGAIPASQKGAASGVAELDANGLVPASQLPSYVDDILEYTAKADFPSTGETGKIYVDTTTNLTYRWSGTAYVEISASLALGTTSSTAFRGDYGNTAYAHATDSSRLTTAKSSGLYKIATTAQGHIASVTAVAKSDITRLGIPAQDTTYSDATTSTHGLMSTSDKSKLNGIASGAEVNQNAFSNVKVGSTTVAADGKTDTLELAGSNVTITPDATNDKVTIGITKANVTSALGYTPPTTNTTYSNATTSAAGLMSSTDKSKLDGIASGAQVNAVTSVAGKTGAVALAAGDVGAVPASGGTFSGRVKMAQGTHVHSATGTDGTAGYVDIATINITATYINSPLVIEFVRRQDNNSTRLYINFASVNSKDPGLGSFKAIGCTNSAWMHKASASTWHLYIQKNEAWDKMGILRYHISDQNNSGVKVTWTNGHANSLPSDCTQASYGGTIGNAITANGHTVNADVPSGAKFTDTTYSNATTSAAGLMSSDDKSKLNGIASGAEVNQNAFSNVKVGSTTVAADGKTDTLELAGSNVTLTPDATNDKVTIGITKANVTAALGYTPPTTNTTYSNATTSAAGLMSADDKTKLNGIAAGAQVNAVTSVAGKTGAVTLAKGDVGLGNVGNFKAVSTAASQGLTDTEKSNARANIGAGTSSFNGAYSSLSGKPTLGSAAAKDVPSSGNASTSQVVMGNDTRLTNSRPASDVSAWAKASTKPSYTASEVGLGNVENKSSATIRSELTKSNVITALGYTPKIQASTTQPSYGCTWFKITNTVTT